MVRIPGAEDSRIRFYDSGDSYRGAKCLFLRSTKAGGRDEGECSNADEGFLMKDRK